MRSQTRFWISGLAASIFMTGHASAAVIAIDSATFAGPAGDEVIVSFIAGANSSGTNPLVGAVTSNTPAVDEYYYGTTDPGSENAALSGLAVTTGTLNTEEGTDFQLGAIGAGDILFLLEYDFSSSGTSTSDDITLAFIDSDGDVIGDYQLVLTNIATGGGNLLTPDPLNREGGGTFQGEYLQGVSFLFDDFTGTAGDLSAATGLTVFDQQSSAQADIAAVGLVTVPEPASIALVILGGVCILSRRIRI